MRKRRLETSASLANGNELNSLFVPFYVLPASGVERLFSHWSKSNRIDGGIALPFVNFGVAVGKGKPGGAVVISGRNVAPLIGVWVM